jgi:hypothetical protein
MLYNTALSPSTDRKLCFWNPHDQTWVVGKEHVRAWIYSKLSKEVQADYKLRLHARSGQEGHGEKRTKQQQNERQNKKKARGVLGEEPDSQRRKAERVQKALVQLQQDSFLASKS